MHFADEERETVRGQDLIDLHSGVKILESLIPLGIMVFHFHISKGFQLESFSSLKKSALVAYLFYTPKTNIIL